MIKCPKCNTWMLCKYVDTNGAHYQCPFCNYMIPENLRTYATTGTNYSMRESTPEESKLITDYINSISTEVVPLVHAHWFESYWEGTGAKCSNCGSVILSYEVDYQDVIHDYDYCPYCGAKMDEEV